MDAMPKVDEIGDIYMTGDYDRCLKEIETYWNSLPEPKENVLNAYLLMECAVRILIMLKDYESALEWSWKGLLFNETRSDWGESEFLVGKVAYEKGDLILAKKFFVIANEKSKGNAFKDEDPMYKKLIR